MALNNYLMLVVVDSCLKVEDVELYVSYICVYVFYISSASQLGMVFYSFSSFFKCIWQLVRLICCR